MKLLLSITIILLLFYLPVELYSQSPTNIEEKVLLRKEYAGHLLLHTNGWGIGFRKYYFRNYTKRWFIEAELVNHKAEKEVKLQNQYFSKAKSFVYGKLYYVYPLRLGVGIRKQIHEKPYWGGLQIKYLFSGGASISFLKPYYLYIFKTINNGIVTYTEEKYNPDKHYLDNIYGRGSFFKGFSEIKINPGLYGRFALNFEFGKNDTKVIALETGVIADFYFKPLQIMALNEGKNFYLNLYIALQLGRRYN